MAKKDKKSTAKGKKSKASVVYFGSAAVRDTDAKTTLPAKLQRILAKFDLKKLAGGERVPIKMHLGGGLGFTTIHPQFVRQVVQAVKDAGGRPFVVDGYFSTIESAAARGYTQETLGCPLIAAGGPYDSHLVTKKVRLRTLKQLNIFGSILDAPCLINFSHVKGHGDCGFGGACKNIAMGCVDGKTRADIHALEGGIEWDVDKCTLCGKCVKACDTGAITIDRKKKTKAEKFRIFFHHCRYCRHCISACPQNALKMSDRQGFRHFQEGMALVTKTVMDSFDPARVLHINLLTNITMVCDCWGFSSPSLVPDIGVMASQDMVALEQASVDAIKVENFIPGSLIGNSKLGEGQHLLERVHGKDPYVQIDALERRGVGTTKYKIVEVN